ncbi:nuclear transport factor 2 family protein [Gordonia zhaorongruii]|uniref:nuclear transport factor 2 family protein n=1 Tax=Gordonia zhaorongruii TaxID=2597659 RepID=UPI001045EC54|nr:nuclear transport factor 2 family protein [Gordonia zhaorongruii]
MTDDLSEHIALQYAASALLHEYQALVDAKDIGGLAGIIHPDVELTRHDGTTMGAQAFLDLYRRFAASDVDVAQHMSSNVVARRGDGGAVDVDSCFLAITTHDAGGARIIWGRYRDSMVEHSGRWKLAAKRISVVRTALVDESSLAPVNIDTFGVIQR